MSFKEWFKSKPYWLKGGIILSFVMLIINISSFIIYSTLCVGSDFIETNLFCNLFLVFFIFTAFFAFTFYLFISSTINTITAIIFGFLVSLIFYFTIGAVTGYIYGKIKSKK